MVFYFFVIIAISQYWLFWRNKRGKIYPRICHGY